MIANRFEHVVEPVSDIAIAVSDERSHSPGAQPTSTAGIDRADLDALLNTAAYTALLDRVECLMEVLLATTRLEPGFQTLVVQDWKGVAATFAIGVTRLARLRSIASRLSRRQRETLQHLLHGSSEKEIARAMHLSVHTIHIYSKAIYAEFEVSSRPELLARWIVAGL